MANLNHLNDLPPVDSVTNDDQIKEIRDKYGFYHNRRRVYSNIFTIIEIVLVIILFVFLIILVTTDSGSTLYSVSVSLTITCGSLMIIGFIVFSIYLSISKKRLKEEEDSLDNWEKLVREKLELGQEKEEESGIQGIDKEEDESSDVL